ncbi:methyltransferase domain-containing protein [Hyphococcus flavus]|uniref:Methyltransferase domain-containing protein n=1 Tax=Hyphococcus flavus TaxID=1866326 RepID=A0AAE9ZDH7_9PROT|nr:methyltransferase domain-containing protein [Hyphococcus flavus]WDI30937.1 methyltransferase domain-containing protein [Hyphococcus flavus]
MKLTSIIAASALAMFSIASAKEIPANIKAGIDNPNRTEDNRARDGDRKPGKVLTFFGVEEGMNVADLASGGGYFSEILSGAVGPDGHVYAHNTASQQAQDSRAQLEEHYASFGNITLDLVAQGEPLPYEDSSMDIVLVSLIVHHLHYAEGSGETMPARSSEVYADIKRILKPGGVFAIIEHTAAPGTTRAESAAWHRAPEETIRADITSAGFEFDGGADIHVNPDDDLKNNIFQSGLRGKTTRMVHRYVKP